MKSSAVKTWFVLVLLMIVSMVVVGGVTRLNGAGLSITEWKPIMGAIPPLNESEWSEAFEKYKAIPQFSVINPNMTMDGFKFIFFWEFIHRFLGRLLGIVVFLPGVFFIFRNKIPNKFTKRIIIGFVLGGLQGALGWFMVASGLSDLVYVSHFRLAAHLVLALFILSYWFNLYLDWVEDGVQNIKEYPSISAGYKKRWFMVLIVLVVQIVYGAFVAGLKAGYAYNTFPKMNDVWIPGIFFEKDTGLGFIFNDIAAVQWIHRWTAMLLLGLVVFMVYYKDQNKIVLKKPIDGLVLLALLFQVTLGIFTLLWGMPIYLASFHQFMGCIIVLLFTMWSREISVFNGSVNNK